MIGPKRSAGSFIKCLHSAVGRPAEDRFAAGDQTSAQRRLQGSHPDGDSGFFAERPQSATVLRVGGILGLSGHVYAALIDGR